MSDSIEPDHSAAAAHSPTDFEKDVVALCGVLEQWRAELKTAEKLPPDESPRFDRRAACYALCFFILYWLATTAASFVKTNIFASHLLSIAALAFLATSPLFILRATGLRTRQSWRALFTELLVKDNYLFTGLLERLRTDFSATSRLRPFSTCTLITVQERITLE